MTMMISMVVSMVNMVTMMPMTMTMTMALCRRLLVTQGSRIAAVCSSWEGKLEQGLEAIGEEIQVRRGWA